MHEVPLGQRAAQLYELARDQWAKRDLLAAVSSFREVLRYDPTHTTAIYDLGLLLVEMARLPEAITTFEALIAVVPDFAAAHAELGSVLALAGRHAEAVECYRRALRIEPGEALYQYNLGTSLVTIGRLDEAIAAYRTCLSVNPQNPDAAGNLGATLGLLGRWQEAIPWHRRETEIRPSDRAYTNLGVALLETDAVEEAIAAFQEAVRLEPESAPAWAQLGAALAESECFADAEAALRRAIALDDRFWWPWVRLAYVLSFTGRAPEGIALCDEALRLIPNNADLLCCRGNLQLQAGQSAHALASFQGALASRHDFAEALGGLAAALALLGRNQEAQVHLRHALELDADYLQSHSDVMAIFSRGSQGQS